MKVLVLEDMVRCGRARCWFKGDSGARIEEPVVVALTERELLRLWRPNHDVEGNVVVQTNGMISM